MHEAGLSLKDGVTVNLGDDGNVISILDAAIVLKFYREACEAQGDSSRGVIVAGENLRLTP